MYAIPWNIFFLWSCRIAAWGFLGPWMKLLDIYGYVQEDDDLQEEQGQQKRREQYEKVRGEVRLQNENEVKMKAMKEYLFGQYVTVVPMVSLERYHDAPLPSSSSQPYQKERGLTLAVRQYRFILYYLIGKRIIDKSTFLKTGNCIHRR